MKDRNWSTNDYTTGCLLDNNYFNNYYKIIDLSKQQAFYAGPKAIQQVNFTANLDTVVLDLLILC